MQNLEIQFNTNVVKRIKSLNFQVDQLGSILFILFALYENRIKLLDEFDDYNKQKRAILLYKELELRGLLAYNKVEEGFSNYVLTKEGIELVEYIKSEFDAHVTSTDLAVAGIDAIKGADYVKMALAPEDVENWIDEWLDIFPRGIKSGGRLIRSDKPSCIRKMRVFLREYAYDKDVILKATRAYIAHKATENYQFTRCAVYFIYRVETSRADKISDLATWCDQTLHDNNNPSHDSENNLEIMA